MILYHGSQYQIEKALEPRVSYHGVPLVYGTTDFWYALIRAGRFDGQPWVREDYTGNDFQIAELVPGAFDHLFNHSGWVYEVDGSKFEPIVNGLPNEFGSSFETPILKSYYYPNIWDEIQNQIMYKKTAKDYFKLIPFDKVDDEYWSHVTGGRKGYMERRIKNAQNRK